MSNKGFLRGGCGYPARSGRAFPGGQPAVISLRGSPSPLRYTVAGSGTAGRIVGVRSFPEAVGCLGGYEDVLKNTFKVDPDHRKCLIASHARFEVALVLEKGSCGVSWIVGSR